MTRPEEPVAITKKQMHGPQHGEQMHYFVDHVTTSTPYVAKEPKPPPEEEVERGILPDQEAEKRKERLREEAEVSNADVKQSPAAHCSQEHQMAPKIESTEAVETGWVREEADEREKREEQPRGGKGVERGGIEGGGVEVVRVK